MTVEEQTYLQLKGVEVMMKNLNHEACICVCVFRSVGKGTVLFPGMTHSW